MEHATVISEQVQRGIELDQKQLGELHEQYLRQARLKSLSHEQEIAVVDLLAQQQAQSSRHNLLTNIAVGFVFYALGVVTPAFISADFLRHLFN
jgi:hypothetical protein